MKKLALLLTATGLLFSFYSQHTFAKAKSAEPWPTTRFEILWRSPSNLNEFIAAVDAIGKTSISKNEKRVIGAWDAFIKTSLSEIAKYYEAQGLEPPFLPMSKDGKRYEIYAHTLSGSSGEYSRCAKDKNGVYKPKDLDDVTLVVDVSKIKKILTVTAIEEDRVRKSYNMLAHELFHSIQATYDNQFKSIQYCSQSSGFHAVAEGTATAAASLATLEKYPDFLRLLKWSFTSVGAFPYGKEEFLTAPSSGHTQYSLEDEEYLDYKTASFWRYLAERFGGEKPVGVFDTLLREKLSAVNLKERYRWLDRGVKKVSRKPLYTLFPEFQAEFASYVTDRFDGKPKDWRKLIYFQTECENVTLSESSDFYGEFQLGSNSEGVGFLVKNGARCINLNWEGAKPEDVIEVEGVHSSEGVIDQLHLGVAWLETDGKVDSCFSEIKFSKKFGVIKRKSKHLECSLGKLFVKEGGEKFIKPWILGTEDQNKKGLFFERKLGASGEAILILTNMADKAENTKEVLPAEGDDLIVRFSLGRSELADGRKATSPEQIQLRKIPGMFPSIPAAQFSNVLNPGNYLLSSFVKPNRIDARLTSQPKIDRYSIYGIKKPAGALPNGLGSSFQISIVGNPKKKYTIAPMDPAYKFEATGKMQAIVSNEKGETSTVCHIKTGMKKVMEVTRSDKEQLRFRIETDICKMKPNGEVEVVDRLEGKFIYAFGRRAYPATAPQDVITPGLELYIDEYLKELARRGVPLPSTVLMSDGSVPGDEDGDGNPDNASPTGPANQTNNNKSVQKGPCTCSCSEYERFKKMAEEARKDRRKARQMRSMLQCMQVCAKKYSVCQK